MKPMDTKLEGRLNIKDLELLQDAFMVCRFMENILLNNTQ